MGIFLTIAAVAAAGLGFFTVRKAMQSRRIMNFHDES